MSETKWPNITVEPTGEWLCPCGNEATADGFFPCDEKGDDQEPMPGWLGLYRCFKCGNVIDKDGNIRGNVITGPAANVEGIEPLKPFPTTALPTQTQLLERAIFHIEQTTASRPDYFAKGMEKYEDAWRIVNEWQKMTGKEHASPS